MPNDPYDSEQALMLYRLHETSEKTTFFIRALALTLLCADQKEHLRKVFKRFCIRFMTGVAMDMFDPVWTRLSAKITETDRQAILQLANQGYRMILLSCGTANLAENTLQKAGLARCFEVIAGNRFESVNGKINTMTLHSPNPADKVKYLAKLKVEPSKCMAVGDGYDAAQEHVILRSQRFTEWLNAQGVISFVIL